MKIMALETIWLEEFGNLIFLPFHTNEGLVDLGETFMGPQAVEEYLHETVAPKLIGEDPLRTEALNLRLCNLSRPTLRRHRDARQLGGRHRAVGHLGKAYGKPVADRA